MNKKVLFLMLLIPIVVIGCGAEKKEPSCPECDEFWSNVDTSGSSNDTVSTYGSCFYETKQNGVYLGNYNACGQATKEWCESNLYDPEYHAKYKWVAYSEHDKECDFTYVND